MRSPASTARRATAAGGSIACSPSAGLNPSTCNARRRALPSSKPRCPGIQTRATPWSRPADDYPPADKLREIYGLRVSCKPLPEDRTLAQFTGILTDEERDEIARQVREEHDQAYRDAYGDLFGGIAKRLRELSEKIADVDDGIAKGQQKRVHESIVGNLADACERARDLDFDERDEIRRAIDAVGDLAEVPVDRLRDDSKTRQEVVAKAAKAAETVEAVAATVEPPQDDLPLQAEPEARKPKPRQPVDAFSAILG